MKRALAMVAVLLTACGGSAGKVTVKAPTPTLTVTESPLPVDTVAATPPPGPFCDFIPKLARVTKGIGDTAKLTFTRLIGPVSLQTKVEVMEGATDLRQAADQLDQFADDDYSPYPDEANALHLLADRYRAIADGLEHVVQVKGHLSKERLDYLVFRPQKLLSPAIKPVLDGDGC